MHIQKHEPPHSFRMTVVIAVVLSTMLVTFTSLIGREAINLKGAIMEPEFKELTVVALLEPYVKEGVLPPIKAVNILPFRGNKNHPSHVAFYVTTEDGESYFVEAAWNFSSGWQVIGEIHPLKNDESENMSFTEGGVAGPVQP